ncbi:unnamed protein product [Ophioblennius macclurei]
MVEQTRRPIRAVSLQAGPGGVGAGTLLDVNLRISDRPAREIGRKLAALGDQLDREWAIRPLYRLPPPLHLLGPARTLTRTIYRDVHRQLWGVQGLSAAVKAWIANTTAAKSFLRTESFTTWVCGLKPESCAGWTRGALVALVAVVSVLGALWLEWKAQ